MKVVVSYNGDMIITLALPLMSGVLAMFGTRPLIPALVGTVSLKQA